MRFFLFSLHLYATFRSMKQNSIFLALIKHTTQLATQIKDALQSCSLDSELDYGGSIEEQSRI